MEQGGEKGRRNEEKGLGRGDDEKRDGKKDMSQVLSLSEHHIDIS